MKAMVTAAVLVLCATATAAQATGGFSCSADDENLKFTAESAFSYGLGGQLVNFKAEARVLVAGTPPTLTTLSLDDALVHSWLYGTELKLRLYRETAGDTTHGFVEIVVETKAPDADATEYSGTYKLVVFSAGGQETTRSGKASCSVG